MKNKGLLILSLIFFLLFNVLSYWDEYIGFWGIPLAVILGLIFLFIGFSLLNQAFIAVKEKSSDKTRLRSMVYVVLILCFTLLDPLRWIRKKEPTLNSLLVAAREANAVCGIKILLMENQQFIKEDICFGVEKTTGSYYIKQDTIHFKDAIHDGNATDFYSFAVIETTSTQHGRFGTLFLYKSQNDTVPGFLFITKNELKK